MAQTIRSAKQKLASGVYSNPIPFGAEAVNIDLANGYNLEDTLGNIDVTNKGAVQAQLDKHTQDIATNKANIESNDVDIINLQSRASVNEANIEANRVTIEINKSNIQKNAENIATNAANIESNDADILSLQNRVSTNETNIAKNTTDISNLDTRVTQEVETINKNIESIEGAFNGDLSELTLKVVTNETNIATNTENIASNNTDIEALKSKDVELQAAIENNDTDIANINTTLEQHTKDIADRVTKVEAAPFIKGIEYNGSTYTFTFTKYDDSTQTIELPFENLIERGYFDTETEEIVLVLSTGEEVKIPAASLVDDYIGKENEQIKVNVANNEIEAVLKTGSVTETHLDAALQERLNTIEDNIATRSEFVEVESW